MTDHYNPSSKEHRQAALFKSASDGDLERFLSVVENVPDIDVRDHQGWTALMLASRYGHPQLVQSLVQFGADVNLVNKSGQTAFKIAEFWNHSECCQYLSTCQNIASSTVPSSQVVNFFGNSPLDRQALQRADKSWIEAAMTDPTTKYILLSKQNVYTLPPSNNNKKHSLCKYSYSQVSQVLNRGVQNKVPIILLGSGQEKDKFETGREKGKEPLDENGKVWFAVDVTTIDSDEIEKMNPEAELLSSNLISLMGFDESQAGILAQAISIFSWHDRYKFCPTCGSRTVMEEAGYKRTCENKDCRSLRGIHNTSYPRLDPVVIMLVIHPEGHKCLLARKKSFPKGMFSCLAGFMEPGESIEDSVRREVKEESSIIVERVQYHSSQPWPMPSQLMIGCHAWATSTLITIDEEELEEAQWFSRQDAFEAIIQGHRGYMERGGTGIFVPPRQAIAHQLIKAWATTSSNL